ncbi:MAG: hypothetical protein ACE5KM_16115 [Planctomycetaceae bacterium]
MPAATFAAHFLRAVPRVVAGVFCLRLLCAEFGHAGRHGVKILLLDSRLFGEVDLFFVAAIRALQRLLPDVEFEVRPAAFAGEDAPLAFIGGLPGGGGCA